VELFAEIVERLGSASVRDLAYTAQHKLGSILGRWACEAAERRGARAAVVSGGAGVNDIIASAIAEEAEGCGLVLRQQRRAPPGDGGIALGQIYYAALME